MNLKKIIAERKRIRDYLVYGIIIGAVYAMAEYFIRIKTGIDPPLFIPLIVRSSFSGALMGGSISIFEILLNDWFRKRRFIYLVLVRSFCYTIIITFWLTIINGIWFVIDDGMPFNEELIGYLSDMYIVNITTIFFIDVLVAGVVEINSLHGKGQLWNFVLGRYHTPREIKLIFCFIDLKSSTTIAEKMGHLQFANFLRDYYSDITEAIRNTNARIYQYVGDEIVLCWTYEKGLKNNNMVNCFFQMRELIENLKPEYEKKYGVSPEFKAGLHGGHVVVTWVGELKKEIVYVGDVLNTTARIQEDCKRLNRDFLISEELLNTVKDLNGVKARFIDDTVLRGNNKHIKLYSLENEG